MALRTPSPARVRSAMASLFTQGLGLGFLGILVSAQVPSGAGFGYLGGAAAVGTLLGILPGFRLFASAAPERWTRTLLVLWAVIAFGGLLTAPLIWPLRTPDWAPALFLGLATGGSLRLSLPLVLSMLPARRFESLLGLAGASLGLGGLVASGVGFAALSEGAVGSVALWAACVPFLLAVITVRAGRLRPDETTGRSVRQEAGSVQTTPRSLLMAASLALQAATCLTAICWLSLHLRRGVGLSGAVFPMIFWAALTTGWAVARRLVKVRDRLASLAGPLVPGGLGAMLLLLGWRAAAVPGTALLGFGVGALIPLTLELGQWPATVQRCPWVRRSLTYSLPVGLLAAWGFGSLAAAAGSAAVVWTILGGFLLAQAALLALVVDFRVTGDPAPV